MNTPWRPSIDVVQDGQPINAATTNVPITELATQAQSLKEQITRLSPASGQVVYLAATLDPSVNANDFVYFDINTNTFKQALAAATQDSSGQYVMAPSSFVAGMVLQKANSTTGDILQTGRINLTTAGVNPNTMVEYPNLVPFAAGRYYLSGKVPGKMTAAVGMPNVQLGFFSTTECQVQLLQKDLFEGHYHYKFALHAQPSASQNYNQTGWLSDGTNKRVDYYNQNGAATPPPMLLCVRPQSGVAPVSGASPIRVELYNTGGNLLGYDLVSGGLVKTSPNAAGGATSSGTMAWPAYGAWVDIPGTNLELSFIRKDNTYAASLAADAVTYLTTTAKRYKIYLPDDLIGWANANLLDTLLTPPGVLYRYLLESDTNLWNVWPPLPVQSSDLELNGTPMQSAVDFVASLNGIWWITGLVSGSYVPWPSDYSLVIAMDPANAINLDFFFTKASLTNNNSVVFGLQGLAPVKVLQYPSGLPGSTGNLQVSVDLNMLLNGLPPVTSDTGLVGVSGTQFQLGNVVSELVQGSGIQIDKLSTTRNINVGQLRISATGINFEQAITDIALRNAKEVGSNPIYNYIDFLPPATAPTGITASFKLPSSTFNPANIKLHLQTGIRGDTATSGSPLYAIFKAIYHVLRPGFALSSLNTGNAVAVQYWIVTFPASYTAGTMLANLYPYDPASDTTFEINPATLATFPTSLVATLAPNAFKLGDVFSVQIDRVAADISGNVDSYPGRVGMLGLRWILQ